jgi:hypothetical protein
VVVVNLTTQLRQLDGADGASADASAAASEEIQKLTDAAKELEATVAAAAAEKEELNGRITESAKQAEAL